MRILWPIIQRTLQRLIGSLRVLKFFKLVDFCSLAGLLVIRFGLALVFWFTGLGLYLGWMVLGNDWYANCNGRIA